MSSDVEIVFNKNQNLLDLGFELIFFFWLCSSKSLEVSYFRTCNFYNSKNIDDKYLFFSHLHAIFIFIVIKSKTHVLKTNIFLN
jgi:hypothetical protein